VEPVLLTNQSLFYKLYHFVLLGSHFNNSKADHHILVYSQRLQYKVQGSNAIKNPMTNGCCLEHATNHTVILEA
jgi:hypothetical protein